MIKTKKRTRNSHDYTDELELKSLLIRIKNQKLEVPDITEEYNTRINKYIKWYVAIKNTKYKDPKRRNVVKLKLKNAIITLSEQTIVDTRSYQRFGEIILLMIGKIITKPNFSGYTYRDDFYSDAVYKILKYLHNYNHLMISKRTGFLVNAFSYISQYIHNSIIFIIKGKNKDRDKIKKFTEHVIGNSDRHKYVVNDNVQFEDSLYNEETYENQFYLLYIENSLAEELGNLITMGIDINTLHHLEIHYPKDYDIGFEEYNEIRSQYKGRISMVRSKR